MGQCGQAGEVVKLHLGCGKRRMEGYLNIDLHDSDLDCDIRTLPFDDGTADVIQAVHVLEHFYYHEIVEVLSEWLRVLKPGGMLIAELPCLDKVLAHFTNGSTQNMTLWALYGDPSTHRDGEPSLHKWCWSKREFMRLLNSVGFTEVEEQQPIFHQPTRDMRWVATK